MNILDLPQIAALLGNGMNPQAPQSSPQMGDPQGIFTRPPSPTAVPTPGPNGNVPTPDDITVSSPISQYRTGILSGKQGNGGFLRPGSLGGNILGALADAFLVQGGANPVYAPKLERLREAEALKGFQAEPDEAIGRLTQVNPQAGIKLYGDQQDYNLKKSSSDLLKRKYDADYQDSIDSGVKAMLANADEKSYPALRDWAMKRYANLGLTPTFDLPSTFDPDAIKRIVESDVPVKDQMIINDTRQNRDAMMALRRDQLAERTQADTARNDTSAARNRDYGRYVDAYTSGVGIRRDVANKMPDRSKWTQPTKGTGTGITGFKKVPDGKGGVIMVPVMAGAK